MISITTLFKKNFDADTDSLTYEIKLEYVYEKKYKYKHLLDFSNFSKDSKFYDNQNEMVVGKMKVVTKEISINKLILD